MEERDTSEIGLLFLHGKSTIYDKLLYRLEYQCIRLQEMYFHKQICNQFQNNIIHHFLKSDFRITTESRFFI